MNDLDTICLKSGLGDLHFGATTEETEAYLGVPIKEKWVYWSDEGPWWDIPSPIDVFPQL